MAFRFILLSLISLLWIHRSWAQSIPFILTTWDTTNNATLEAWELLYEQQQDVVDSVVGGCSVCEMQKECGARVGPGDKPSESGEVTQDAMIMDGRTMQVGSVGCLRRVKNAIRVAEAVMKYTTHTLLVGELATEFAVEMGFPEEDINSNRSWAAWQQWRDGNCQPNFRQNVSPDPDLNCGPYIPISSGSSTEKYGKSKISDALNEDDHDTIGMIAVDANGNVASGTSTNGLSFKIPGRVGDSPIPGAGAFAENGVGAAAATGNGDVMLRMLPSYHAVMMMGSGATPQVAAQAAIDRIALYYPGFNVALLTANVNGEHGVACAGYTDFPYHYISPATGGLVESVHTC